MALQRQRRRSSMTELFSSMTILSTGFAISLAVTSFPPIVKQVEVALFPCATAVRSDINPREKDVLISGVLNKHRDCTPLAITVQAYDTENLLAPAEPLKFQSLEEYRSGDEMVSRSLGLQLYGPWSVSRPTQERSRVELDVHHQTPFGNRVRTRFLEFELESGGDASE